MPQSPLVYVKTETRGNVHLDAILREFTDIAKKQARIGILEPKRTYPDSPATLGEVALWNEFGVHDRDGKQRVPARSFIRSTVDKRQEAVYKMLEKAIAGIVDEKLTAVDALRAVGVFLVNAIRSTIKRRIDPALAPLTLKLRKEQGITGTIPLLATHFLYNSISFAVRDVVSGDD